jgi:hypothetical protein
MSYENLAKSLMFGQMYISELEPKYGLKFRKNKTSADISTAVAKGLRTGMGKVENELSMIEVYLKKVLIPVKKSHDIKILAVEVHSHESELFKRSNIAKIELSVTDEQFDNLYRMTPNKRIEYFAKILLRNVKY